MTRHARIALLGLPLAAACALEVGRDPAFDTAVNATVPVEQRPAVYRVMTVLEATEAEALVNAAYVRNEFIAGSLKPSFFAAYETQAAEIAKQSRQRKPEEPVPGGAMAKAPEAAKSKLGDDPEFDKAVADFLPAKARPHAYELMTIYRRLEQDAAASDNEAIRLLRVATGFRAGMIAGTVNDATIEELLAALSGPPPSERK